MSNSNILIFLTAALGLLATSCEFEASTARIDDVKTCVSLSGDLCEQDQTVFSPTDPQISVSCRLANAPADTKVKFVWRYVEGEPRVIDTVTLDSGEKGSNLVLGSNLTKPTAGWPVGKYEVEISLGDNDESPVVKSFEVK